MKRACDLRRSRITVNFGNKKAPESDRPEPCVPEEQGWG